MKVNRIIGTILLISILISPIGNVISVGESKEPLAIVNGKEFYGSYRDTKSKEMIVDEIINTWLGTNLYFINYTNKDRDIIVKNLEKHFKEEYKKYVERNIIDFLIEEGLINANKTTVEKIKSIDNEEYRKMISDYKNTIYTKMVEDIDANYLEKFISDTKNRYYKEIFYFGFRNIEDANEAYEILNSEENKEKLIKSEELIGDYSSENTLYNYYLSRKDEINNLTLKTKINYANGGNTFYSPERETYGFGPKSIGDKIAEIGKDLKVGEITKPKEYDELGVEYYILIGMNEKELSYEELKRIYYNKVFDEGNEKILKENKVEIVYPEIKYEEKLGVKVKIARVNNIDIYKNSLDIIDFLDYGDDIELKEEAKESIFKGNILTELERQDMQKRGYDTSTDKFNDEHIEYNKALRNELEPSKTEINKFIVDNKEELISYKYGTFVFINEDTTNELYNRLKQDYAASSIANIFNVKVKDNIELTVREENLLKSIKMDDFNYPGYGEIDRYQYTKNMENSFPSIDKEQFNYKEKELEILKKLKIGELSELITDGEYGINQAFVLLEIKDDRETMEKSAKQYLLNKNINDYKRNLFDKADIKYY